MNDYTIDDIVFLRDWPLLTNHLDDNASFDGCMFETYGPEHEFVRQQNPLCIWTVLEDFDGNPAVASGYKWVNRLGYLISTRPRGENDRYWVQYEREQGDKDYDP